MTTITLQSSAGKPALSEVESLMSKYLMDGVYQDRLSMTSVDLNPDAMSASFALESYGVSPEDAGGFHLTAPTVFRMAGQMLVMHVHWLAGFSKKSVEVWVRDHQISHRRPSRNPHAVPVTLTLTQAGPGARNPHMLRVAYNATFDGDAVSGQTVSYADFSGHEAAFAAARTRLQAAGKWVEPSATAAQQASA